MNVKVYSFCIVFQEFVHVYWDGMIVYSLFNISFSPSPLSLWTGVLISSGSKPQLTRNRVFGGRAAGIEVTNGGGGVIEENEVFDNHYDGICLATGVSPKLRSESVNKIQSFDASKYDVAVCRINDID